MNFEDRKAGACGRVSGNGGGDSALVRGLAALAVLAAPFFCHAQPGIITTVAGITGSSGFAGDGGPATSARISPDGVAVDGLGNVYTAESGNDRIRKINTAGVINTIAGNGTGGYSGDGGPGTSAALSNPMRVGVDAAGNAYFPVLGGHIRKVTTAGIVSTVAGGALGFSGDGGPAIRAGISQAPFGVAVDSPGNNFYFADSAYQPHPQGQRRRHNQHDRRQRNRRLLRRRRRRHQRPAQWGRRRGRRQSGQRIHRRYRQRPRSQG